jgi:DNA-binding response OmpR family regulator
MNILIIDDSRFLRMANERALTRVGHNVVCASDGEEGLRLALERKPDLVVLDMPLPKVSGPDVRAPCARPRKPRRSR